jgi:hypothetical protein
MEKLEKEFEEMLVKTNNAELIDKYADLKAEIHRIMEQALRAMNSCMGK